MITRKTILAVALTMISGPAMAGSSCCSPGWEIRDLKAAQALLEGTCRGSELPDNATCAARDVADAALNAMGWCWGEPGQGENDSRWHKCHGETADKKAGEALLKAVQDARSFIDEDEGDETPTMVNVTADLIAARKTQREAAGQ